MTIVRMTLHHQALLALSALLLFPSVFAGGCATASASGQGSGHGIAVGDTPAFTLPIVSAGGGSRSLTSLRGKVVLVDFWASWCAPCKEAMPFYAELQARYPERLVVLGINEDEDRAAMEAALAASPPGFEILRDEGGVTALAFGVEAMPTSFLIDQEGRVVLVHKGFVAADRAMLEAQVAKLVGQ